MPNNSESDTFGILMDASLVPKSDAGLPPILSGTAMPDVLRRVGQFYASVASIFEAWVTRRQSLHTQRTYGEDVMTFLRFPGIAWPEEATALFLVSVKDVLEFREELVAKNAAPKTINRRISSLSSFYKYLAAAAAEMRLPIMVPNPAHAQFISRESTDPREETRALSGTRARQLIGLPGRRKRDRLPRSRYLENVFCGPASGSAPRAG